MKWFARTTFYATLLAWPGHWIAPAYQSMLIDLAEWVTGTSLIAPAIDAVDLSAANLLTVFAALCLASGFVTWARRLWAIALGLPILVSIECVAGVLDIHFAPISELSHAHPSAWHPILEQAPELSRWLAVPLCWGLLLGRAALSRNLRPIGP